MPYSGAGVYSFAPRTLPADGETIDASDVVTPLEDLAEAQNAARPVVAGGTGATTASAARTNLGVAIGSDVQAYNALLSAVGALSMVADRYVYGTGTGTVALGTITSFARTLLDDATAATARTTLGLSQAIQPTASGAGTDLDDIAESGVYTANGATVANVPGAAQVHAIWHAHISSTLAAQVALDLSTNYVYSRAKAGGTWGAWQTVAPIFPIGVSQTWQDLSSSRVGNTSYQNTTGRPIMVAIRGVNNASHEFQVSTNGSTWVALSSATNNGVPLSFIVPSSHYYRYTGGSYNSWVELR